MKILKWLSEHILFVLTLFLLAFIPLYPKLPLIDIKNTWVYIRVEDFLIVLVLVIWVVLLLQRKISLKTPLTLPIMIFWIVGAISTTHAMLLIFPTIANVFPNVAFYSFLRHIEYVSVFFIGYAGIKDKRFLPLVIVVLVGTLFTVIGYGLGQKYYQFPAFLTMNEEFAKGVPITLSSLSRVPSTFAGHYDLAAYLVLIIPILTSLVFGLRNWFAKILLLVAVLLGFVLLFMTVSRVSFFVLLVSLAMVLFFQKKRLILYSIPVIIMLGLISLSFSSKLIDRFGSTVKEVNVLVDAKTGEAIGNVKIVPPEYFKEKTVKARFYRSRDEFNGVIKDNKQSLVQASASAIVPFSVLPPQGFLLSAADIPTGENLPQGTGYINLSLSPVTHKIGGFFYEKGRPEANGSEEALIFYGDFLVKKAAAYDLSFTTRFQGEWPNTLKAFERNIFLGSGYSSVSLAVDNNYLRILGETGLLGFASFFGMFLIAGIYMKKILPEVDSPMVKSFIIGFAAGIIGLALNAVFIDVFEASKIAFILWLLMGVVLGTLSFYQKKSLDLLDEVKNVLTSSYAIVIYLLALAVFLYSSMVNNYFLGDDFTWFRWIADCNKYECKSLGETIFGYFTRADGFFYRPGAKLYFLAMYSGFWLNQTMYHIVSLVLHFSVAVLFFFLAKKILRDFSFSVLATFLFLLLSGYSEAVFWISSTGFLFNALFVLASLLFFIAWEEKKKSMYLVFSILSFSSSLLFHELGVVTPLLIILYQMFGEKQFSAQKILTKAHNIFLFIPLIPYLALRFFAHSHWFNGDYSYNLLKLPLNTIGNAIGYLLLSLVGPLSLPFYQIFRNITKVHVAVLLFVSLGIFVGAFAGYQMFTKKVEKEDKRVLIFGVLFFAIALLPFLGLGNITSRYSYLASMGTMLLFAFFMKKLHEFLKSSGKYLAISGVTVVIALFCVLHIMQLQQVRSNWYEAGRRVKTFLTSIDSFYEDYWAKETMRLYFVNVPIRQGEAWIFPVGLEDALWLSFRNPNMHIYMSSSVDEALGQISGSRNEKVFVFEDSSGAILEKKKILPAQ